MDDEEFNDLVDQYSRYAYNIAFRLLNHHADAEDAVQDAFLSAYRARHTYRRESAVTTWLYRIVVNAALQKIRREHRSQTIGQGALEHFEVSDWRPGPESEALNSELRSVLQTGLATLPEEFRMAVVLRDFQQLENAEAAAILDISVSAFKARLHRGRVALRNMVLPYLKRPSNDDA
ncbi:MAG: RNA polymerase sigma factor [Dehalococcoidia bacterium]